MKQEHTDLESVLQTKKRIVSVLLTVLMVYGLVSCSSVKGNVDYSNVTIHTDPSPEAIENLVLYVTADKEMKNHNIFQTTSLSDIMVLSNVIDCLLTQDKDGRLVPSIAESWGKNEDATIWTFHLRDDVTWADMNGKYQADCTAEDFVTGLEWVLNYHKGNAANIQMPVSYIKGAQEYFDYTKSLTQEEAWKLPLKTFLDYVGIEVPDRNTVVYHLKKSCPYFDSVTTYVSFYPASQALIDAIGIDEFRLSPYYEVWYNGPYLMTEFISGNEKILDANPLWYGNDENTRFRSVTYKVLEDSSIAYQLYKTGEVDQVTLSQSQLSSILSDPDSEYFRRLTNDYPLQRTYQITMNYNKINEDGTPDDSWNKAAANEAFRKSIYYGLDLTEYLALKDPIDPLGHQAETISMNGLAALSDGTDYADLVRAKINLPEKQGMPDRLDPEKALEYKELAVEELTALGVTFPISIDYYVEASSQINIDGAKILKGIFEKNLGMDYISFNIHTTMNYPLADEYPRGLHSISLSGWVADFGDPINVLTQYLYSDKSGVFSKRSTHILKLAEKMKNGELEEWRKQLMEQYTEFERLVAAADAVNDDTDARLLAFAEAERYAIEHCLIGAGLEVTKNWELTNIDNTTYSHSGYGSGIYRYVNLKTYRNGYVPESNWYGVGPMIPEDAPEKEAAG